MQFIETFNNLLAGFTDEHDPVRECFNPADYGYRKATDGWLDWSRVDAHEAAREARDSRAMELIAQGYQIKTDRFNCEVHRRGQGAHLPRFDHKVTMFILEAN